MSNSAKFTGPGREISVQPVGDALAEVRGLDGKLLGEWILAEDRSGPWHWVPMAAEAPRDLPLVDTLTAAAAAIRAWFREEGELGSA